MGFWRLVRVSLLSDMFNLSLAWVPWHWDAASILPTPKSSTPLQLADYRPISITPVLCLVLERTVARDFIYPSFRLPLLGLSFHDWFAFSVTISRRFSVTEHVDNLLVSGAQSLFAMRTLRLHGLPTNVPQAVFLFLQYFRDFVVCLWGIYNFDYVTDVHPVDSHIHVSVPQTSLYLL